MRLFLLFIFIITSCTNDPKLVQGFVRDKKQPVEQIKGALLLHTEKGKVKVKVIANNIERFQEIQPSLIFSNFLNTSRIHLEELVLKYSKTISTLVAGFTFSVYFSNISTSGL